MTSPIACILKPNGEDIRLAVEYRYLNRFTIIPDSVGPPEMASIVQRIGRAKFISTFDVKRSFWTIPLRPEEQWLTAFLCDAGEFECCVWSPESGSSFVRMTTKALQPVNQFAACFVEYSALYCDSCNERLQQTYKYLQVIHDCGLILALKNLNLRNWKLNSVVKLQGWKTDVLIRRNCA
jgi:hypothetical protein